MQEGVNNSMKIISKVFRKCASNKVKLQNHGSKETDHQGNMSQKNNTGCVCVCVCVCVLKRYRDGLRDWK
jgi:hypothetical protein